MTPLPPDTDTVLFDLDGTLVDNFTAIHVSCVEVARELGLPEMSYDTVRNAVGGSITVTMSRLLPHEVGDRAVALYRKIYGERMFEGLFVYDGVEALLKKLRSRGFKTGVFTNKEINATRRLLDHTGLAEYFDVVVGTGDTPWRKPDPGFAAHTLALLNSEAGRTILVGDSPFDIAAARNGKFAAVYCVTTGSHDADGLAPEAPDGIFPGMAELGEAVFA